MYSSIDTIWILACIICLFSSQVGFVILEISYAHSKSIENIIIKNLLIFASSIILFMLCGFGLIYGDGNSLWGWIDFGSARNYGSVLPHSVPVMTMVIFRALSCSFICTIISGAITERNRLTTIVLFCLFISIFIYPVSGHWVIGNGWLKSLGYADNYGSSLVHILGGAAALIASIYVGPRSGKYNSDGSPNVLLRHNMILSIVGIFIIWISWFGYVSCFNIPLGTDSTYTIAKIFRNTLISSSVSAITTILYTKHKYSKPDLSFTLNGIVSGLVGISCVGNEATFAGAMMIGICSALITLFSYSFIDQQLHIDDPIGLISSHGCSGIFGALCVGLFSTRKGLLYTGNPSQLFIQLAGIITTVIFVIVCSNIFFIIADLFEKRTDTNEPMVPVEKAIPVFNSSSNYYSSTRKLTKLEIIINEDKFDTLKKTLLDLGVTGLTVNQVLGSGTQRGFLEYVQGIKTEINLLPKTKVEIVVSSIPVEKIIQSVRSSLYTGKIGDGKIFVTDIEDVVKIRTGERGYDALQDATEELNQALKM